MMETNSVHLFVKHVIDSYNIDGPILDLGSGPKPVKYLFPNKEYVGVDLDNADINADVHKIPVENESYPTIITIESLEHFKNPFIVFKEIGRILKPGGYIILTTVFQWPIHNFPTDFWRFTPNCIEMLMRDNNIKPLHVELEAPSEIKPTGIHVFGLGIKQ